MGFFKKNITKPKVRIIRTNISSNSSRSIRRTPALRLGKSNAGGSIRSFDGGKKTRLTKDWNAGLNTNLNLDLRTYKKTLDERSEDLIKNNPYIAGYHLRETANVIGHQ